MSDLQPLSIALILGSGPSAPRLRDWSKPDNVRLVAINNAWRVRPDWDYLVHAGDFPATRMPDSLAAGQSIHSHESYVPAQNSYGGFVYGGGTMAFTAGYWALAVLRPDILAYYACDMTYSGNVTHFYGQGTADPLRPDVTLQSLEAKIHPPHGAGGQAGLRLHQSVDGAEQPAFVSESRTARTWQARARIPDRRRRGGSGAQRGGLAWLSDRGWRILASHAPF